MNISERVFNSYLYEDIASMCNVAKQDVEQWAKNKDIPSEYHKILELHLTHYYNKNTFSIKFFFHFLVYFALASSSLYLGLAYLISLAIFFTIILPMDDIQTKYGVWFMTIIITVLSAILDYQN